jgi:general stress protein 26
MAIDQKEELSGEEALAKLRELLEHFPIAFMVTLNEGHARARPLGVVSNSEEFSGTLWFITDRRSRKVAEITGGARTTLLFQNDERGTYAHMRGRATVVDDRQKLAEMYTTDQRTWFPDGLHDPDMTLVRFDVDEADYWDGHASMVRKAVAFAKSVVTGQAGRDGDTGVARLRHHPQQEIDHDDADQPESE